VLTCDAVIPVGARTASISGQHLPAFGRNIRRIVVIGDTGCRLKAADDAYQACNDPAAYPFARIAARAAKWKPQLVIHVGDYHYRENPCPQGNRGCEGSPWGYGWDAWNADFFAPGAPLLAAAPWVVVRGNHENCPRAGQGWWRLIDPRPISPNRDCNRPEDDGTGDAATVYAVPIGGGARVIVADLATSPDKAIDPSEPRFVQYTAVQEQIRSLADGGTFNLVATHKPILGVAATRKEGQIVLRAATVGTQSVFAIKDPNILPESIDAILSGHVHLWEQISFASRYPTQFISGFSGTLEDVVPLPERLPRGYTPASGVAPDAFASWTDGFGYLTLERRGPRRWKATVWNVDGRKVNRCILVGRRSRCLKQD
jgi:Calcineurin-like phosphoesterase